MSEFMRRDSIIDGVRRECLRLCAQALVQAGADDEVRQACLDGAATLVDALVRVVARQTVTLGGRESRAVAEVLFVHAWPVIAAEHIPAILMAVGGHEKIAQGVRSAIESAQREVVPA